jgi:hypothetical protein
MPCCYLPSVVRTEARSTRLVRFRAVSSSLVARARAAERTIASRTVEGQEGEDRTLCEL